MSLKRTPLFECHKKLGGKLVPFAGWEMPVQYSGVINEHNNCRSSAGIFDVSHMGEIEFKGREAESALDYLTCNDVRGLTDGKAQYSAITNHQGGVVDDIIIYRFNKQHYLLCVNASNSDKDFQWLSKENKFEVEITNRSSDFGQIAIQGPKAVAIVEKLIGTKIGEEIAFFHHKTVPFLNSEFIVARTGYTGEDGFEIFTPAAKTSDLWQALLEVGGSALTPCGLGARDSLRLEACLPLYGHELHDDVTAIESGLGWVVRPEKKGDFCGRAVLEKQKKSGAPRGLIGFYLDEPGIAREHDKVLDLAGKEIGEVTSGTKTPFLNVALGMAIVKSDFTPIETKLKMQVRGREIGAHVVKRPFYRRAG